ncbi:MAG: antitoxin Xre/MbcA/ParS toxin-binding domain-containing protein [Saprospiraceae bacterium]
MIAKLSVALRDEKKINASLKAVLGNSFSKEIGLSGLFYDQHIVIQLIRAGIPYSLFELIQKVTPLTEAEWSEFLEISLKTFSRYKADERSFKPIHSEKILEIAEVSLLGLEVFGSMEKFKTWLETPSFALGNDKPIDLMKDSYGKELVIGELTRIEHGIFA